MAKRQSNNNGTGINFECQYTSLQKKVLNFFRSNSISLLTGDPGTGKTFCALYYALMMLKDKAISEIVISKPIVEVGRSMGFLPGTEEEKVEAYMASYASNIDKIAGMNSYKYLLMNKKIRFEPVNFVRGTTFDNALVILDEAQGLTLHELVTFSTRLSQTSQLIMMGDPFQADIRNSGFTTFIDVISKDIPGVGIMELGEEYQMRHPMIVQLYKNYKQHLSTL
jgi:phosphate starvation-inducible PhoH-like protein